jgi:hypothetical protein
MHYSINDISYLSFCSKGSYINDPNGINYEVDQMTDKEAQSFFLYVIFYKALFELLNKLENGKEVAIENIESGIFRKMKGFIPFHFLTSPLEILRFEKIATVISSKIISILNSVNGGVILNLNNKISTQIRTLGSSSYVDYTLDLAYFDADGDLHIILFEPYKVGSIYNIKTGAALSFWEEISSPKDITVYSLGSDFSALVDKSFFVAFNETYIELDQSRREKLLKIGSSINNTFIHDTVSYYHCHVCPLKNKCRHKIHV